MRKWDPEDNRWGNKLKRIAKKENQHETTKEYNKIDRGD